MPGPPCQSAVRYDGVFTRHNKLYSTARHTSPTAALYSHSLGHSPPGHIPTGRLSSPPRTFPPAAKIKNETVSTNLPTHEAEIFL